MADLSIASQGKSIHLSVYPDGRLHVCITGPKGGTAGLITVSKEDAARIAALLTERTAHA